MRRATIIAVAIVLTLATAIVADGVGAISLRSFLTTTNGAVTSAVLAAQTCIFDFASPAQETPGAVVCTMDAKQCPDGSYVGRVAPNCDFAPCPAVAAPVATTTTATTVATSTTTSTATTTAATGAAATVAVPSVTGLLVPLYSEPGDTWTRLAAVAAAGTPVVAIINPDNGPGGETPSAAYVAGIARLRAAGVTVLGYVYTGYGQRPQETVRADARAYLQRFELNGIFVDETANTDAQAGYYRDLYRYIKDLAPAARVVVNPGTPVPDAYFAAADTVVQFEDTADAWGTYTVPAAVAAHPRVASAMLAHSVGSVDTMKAIVQRAVSAGFGYVYVTDDVLDNPWDTLPTYLDAERAAL